MYDGAIIQPSCQSRRRGAVALGTAEPFPYPGKMGGRIVLACTLLGACGRLGFDEAELAAPTDGTTGDGIDPRTLVPDHTVAVVEAEAGSLTAPFVIRSDPEASGDSYVFDDFFESGHASTGAAIYQVTLPATADYWIWVRARAPDTASDSFFISIDDNPRVDFDTSMPGISDPAWHWIAAAVPVDPFPQRVFALTAGSHTIALTSRETWSTVDRIAITTP